MDLSNEQIIHKKGEKIEYLQFKKLLELGIPHAYTLKQDGIDFSLGTEERIPSYQKICKELNLNYENIQQPKQNHTDKVVKIENKLNQEQLTNIDGLITNQKDIILATTNADCILYLLYDKKNNVIGNIHSGWKGTYKRIIEKAIDKMIEEYNSDPKDIIICICPSIRKCHFEVDKDIKDMFEEKFQFTQKTQEFIIPSKTNPNNKYYIDTVKLNNILLTNKGINVENIIDSNICSVCNKEKINSFRVEGEGFKRATAIITLK